jgi:hypothetical protein
MNLGMLTRSERPSARGRACRWSLLAAAALLLLGLWGCNDDQDDPVYPPRPEPEAPTWVLGMWGFGATDIWAVGQPGLILHYDGNWTRFGDVPTDQPLVSVWGPASNGVYACGHKGTILRWNGSSWSRMNSGTQMDLFGVGRFEDGATYCVGADWTILRLEGGAWRPITDPVVRRNQTGETVIDTLQAGEDPLFLTRVNYYGLGGKDGRVVMRDNPGSIWYWQLKLVPRNMLVTSTWSDPDRLSRNFLGTDAGALFRLTQEGTQRTWGELDAKDPMKAAIYGILADQDTVYVVTRDGEVIRRRPGGIRTKIYDGLDMLYAIWGTSGSDFWVAGIDEQLRHWNGATWQVEVIPGEDGLKSLQALPASDPFGRPLP